MDERSIITIVVSLALSIAIFIEILYRKSKKNQVDENIEDIKEYIRDARIREEELEKLKEDKKRKSIEDQIKIDEYRKSLEAREEREEGDNYGYTPVNYDEELRKSRDEQLRKEQLESEQRIKEQEEYRKAKEEQLRKEQLEIEQRRRKQEELRKAREEEQLRKEQLLREERIKKEQLEREEARKKHEEELRREKEELANSKIIEENKEYAIPYLSMERNNYLDISKRIDETIENFEKEINFKNDDINDMGQWNHYSNSEKYDYIGRMKEKIATYKEASNSPYFGRLIVSSDIGREDMYIGQKSLIDENQNQIVYDWRSKVCSLFYTDQVENRIKLQDKTLDFYTILKRRIKIENKKFIEASNIYVHKNKGKVYDEFLNNILKQKKKDTAFSNIIETIQSWQNNLIRADINDNILCQGVAGCGKTAIILHRLSYLLFNYPEIKASKYLIICPSTLFKDNINQLNIQLGINSIAMETLNEYYWSKLQPYLKDYKPKNKEIIEDNSYIDQVYSIIKEEYIDFINTKCSEKYVEGENIYNRIKDYYTYISSTLQKEESNDENDKNQDYISTLKNEKIDCIKKLDIISTVDNILEKVNENAIYKKPSKKQINSNTIKLILYVCANLGFKFKHARRYMYVYVDEAQNYDKYDLSIITKLENNKGINIYGDLNQYMGDKEKQWKDIIEPLKDSMRCYRIEYNYRNTVEVVEYCNKQFGTNIKAIGPNGNPVIEKELSDSLSVLLQYDGYVYITNNNSIIEYLKNNSKEVYTVDEVKGMEFSNIVVIDDHMKKAEQYVSFTRTLNDLVVFKKN